MYSIDQVRRGVRRGLSDPALFVREFNRLYHRRFSRREHNTDGIDVVEEDWDTLLVLDACRYDMFEEQSDLPGRLERRQSRGSHTTEFLHANFQDRTLDDVVYVTASPQLSRWRDELGVELHAVVDVWREAGWSEEHGTVRPETMAEHVRDATEQYPNKRIVGHFMQPHYPFIGADDALNARTFGDDGNGDGGGDEVDGDVWHQLRTGELDVSPGAVWDAYRRNLEVVLPVVRDLLEELQGRTVVTADHGNMVGEQSSPIPMAEWGHPPGIYTPELVEVPWLVHENGPRREIVSGELESGDESGPDPRAESGDGAADEGSDETSDDVVEDRLRQLGYVS